MLLSDVGRDVRAAFRQLVRAPGLTIVALLCLGLGLGVNTAVFGLVDAVLLRPMAVTDPDRLTIVNRGESTAWSYPVYRDFASRIRTLSGLAVSLPMESDLDIDGESEFVTAELVSASYGLVLGVTPLLGRWFEDDGKPAAVISYAVWQRRFDSSPTVLGRRIGSQSESYTIVGVAPAQYTGVLAPLRTDLWLPIRTRTSLSAQLDDRRETWRGLVVFGRLRPDATAAQASAELNAIDAQLAREYGPAPQVSGPLVAEPVRAIGDRGMRRRAEALATLLSAVPGA